MFDERYRLFIRPDKASRDNIETHQKSKGIVEQIDFMREYYRKPSASYNDKSTIYFFKVDIHTNTTDIRWYINDEPGGAADFGVTGIGGCYDVPVLKSWKFLILFDSATDVDSIASIIFGR